MGEEHKCAGYIRIHSVEVTFAPGPVRLSVQKAVQRTPRLPLPLAAGAGSAAASAGRRGRRDARRWRKQHRKPLPCEVAEPERQRLVQVCSVFEVGPGRGEGVQAPAPLLTIAPLAVCLFLPAGAMAAERIRPLRDSGGPRAPSRCEPRARSRASGRSLRSVPRGTGLRELGTWERRTS